MKWTWQYECHFTNAQYCSSIQCLFPQIRALENNHAYWHGKHALILIISGTLEGKQILAQYLSKWILILVMWHYYSCPFLWLSLFLQHQHFTLFLLIFESWLKLPLKWIGCLFAAGKFTLLLLNSCCYAKYLFLCFHSSILLVSLSTDLSQNNLSCFPFLSVEGRKKVGQLYRKHFTSLLECISHPYFGIPGQFVLVLFISIYAFNGFSIAN